MPRVADLGHVGQVVRPAQAGGEGRLEAAQRLAVEFVKDDALAAPLVLGHVGSPSSSSRPPQTMVAVVDAGLLAQLPRQGGIHGGTVRPQPVERRRRPFGVARRNDAGAGPRRLLAEVALVEQR